MSQLVPISGIRKGTYDNRIAWKWSLVTIPFHFMEKL